MTDRVPKLEGSIQVVGKVDTMSNPIAALALRLVLDLDGSRIWFGGKLVEVGLDGEAEGAVILFQERQSVRG